MTARLPDTAIGRSISFGCSTIAAISSSRVSDSSSSLSSLNIFSRCRMRSRGAISNWPRIVSSSSAEGGVFRYSKISGSTPCSRSRLTACLDLLQRGLYQTVMPTGTFLLTGNNRRGPSEPKQELGIWFRVQGSGCRPALHPVPCTLCLGGRESEIPARVRGRRTQRVRP